MWADAMRKLEGMESADREYVECAKCICGFWDSPLKITFLFKL